MKSVPETGARRRFWALFLIAAALAVVCILFFQKQPPPPEVPKPKERLRNELEMKDGRMYYAGKPFSGIVFDQYEEGKIKSRSTVSNGLLEGLSEGWYTNGVKQVTEHFSRGVSQGARIKYHPN